MLIKTTPAGKSPEADCLTREHIALLGIIDSPWTRMKGKDEDILYDRYGVNDRMQRRHHVRLIITAVSANLLIWLLLNAGSPEFSDAGAPDYLLNLLQIAAETIVLIELSRFYSKRIITGFLKRGYSKDGVARYGIMLLVLNLATAGLFAIGYKFMFPDSDTVFLETLFSDVIVCSIVTGSIFINSVAVGMWKLENERKQAELDKLTLYTDPHFIFNSFSNLAELIETDSRQAEEYLSRLSDLYRHIIRCRDRPRIPVREEAGILEDYIALMQFHHEGIQCTIDRNIYDMNGDVPPMALQTLVENAIKHNSHSASAPIEISISVKGEGISVTNGINPLKSAIRTEKTGLKNLDSRYSFLCGKHIDISSSGETFSVTIPVIT